MKAKTITRIQVPELGITVALPALDPFELDALNEALGRCKTFAAKVDLISQVQDLYRISPGGLQQ